jgi:hypothetical protein
MRGSRNGAPGCGGSVPVDRSMRRGHSGGTFHWDGPGFVVQTTPGRPPRGHGMTETIRPDICVVGAGGVQAAVQAAAFGVPVVLVDPHGGQPEPNGRRCGQAGRLPLSAAARRAHDLAQSAAFGVQAKSIQAVPIFAPLPVSWCYIRPWRRLENGRRQPISCSSLTSSGARRIIALLRRFG